MFTRKLTSDKPGLLNSISLLLADGTWTNGLVFDHHDQDTVAGTVSFYREETLISSMRLSAIQGFRLFTSPIK